VWLIYGYQLLRERHRFRSAFPNHGWVSWQTNKRILVLERLAVDGFEDRAWKTFSIRFENPVEAIPSGLFDKPSRQISRGPHSPIPTQKSKEQKSRSEELKASNVRCSLSDLLFTARIPHNQLQA